MKAQSLLLAVLFTSGLALADHHDTAKQDGVANPKNVSQHNLSRRPYSAPVANKADQAEDSVDDMVESESEKTYKKIQLHNLGRRPYAEK